jgi:membrane protease YdiL (CAAX protease family)
MNQSVALSFPLRAAKLMTLPVAFGLVVFQSLFNFGAMGALGSRVLPDPEHPLLPSLPLLALTGTSAAVILPVLWYFCFSRPQRTFADLGWNLLQPLRTLAVGTLAGCACIAVLACALFGLGVTPAEIMQSVQARGPLQWLTFLGIGVVAALAEETLFRGNLQKALETKMRPIFAATLCATVFALYHLSPTPIGLGVKFCGGMIFWAARVHGKSLAAPAIAHVLFWCMAGDL